MSDGRVLFCRGEEDEADHDDIWDDTELIAAYDRALASARAELGMTGGLAEEKPSKKWCIGDYCRAVYSEDGQVYEAAILSMGGARCRLRYVGYGNEEDQPLARLQTSGGKKARRKQEKDAEAERQAEQEVEEEEYEEDDGEDEEEEEDAEEEAEEIPKADKSVQQSSKKGRNRAHQGDNDAADRYLAGGEGYPTASQQWEQPSHYAARHYPASGPWGAGSEHRGPATGPWGPHFGPWGPRTGPWGPPHGPWGASTPFGAWGLQAQHGYQGPTGAGAPFQAHPLPPPPPPPVPGDTDPVQLANMLMSWYISGYHTGYYQANRDASNVKTARK